MLTTPVYAFAGTFNWGEVDNTVQWSADNALVKWNDVPQVQWDDDRVLGWEVQDGTGTVEIQPAIHSITQSINQMVGIQEVVRANVNNRVLQYTPLFEKYADKYGISEYIELIKALAQQENSGYGPDVLQSSECQYNKLYPNTPNSIKDEEYSIDCGIHELATVLHLANVQSPTDIERIKLALYAYNMGGGFVNYANSGIGTLEEKACSFSDMQAQKLGWNRYGDKKYANRVLQYYGVYQRSNSDSIYGLIPEMQTKMNQFLELCNAAGLPVKVTETFRTVERQNALYAQGRTKPGAIVTYANGNDYESAHEWGVAFDVCRNAPGAEYSNDGGFFDKVGSIGMSLGMNWGGNWSKLGDAGHFELNGFAPQDYKSMYGTPDNLLK